MLMEAAFVLLSFVSLLLWLRPLWSARAVLSVGFAVVEITLIVGFAAIASPFWTLVFTSVGLYKLFNLARVGKNRMQPDYLRQATRRTAIYVSVFQAVVAAGAGFGNWPVGALYGAAIVQLLLALMLFSSTKRHLRTTKTLQATTAYTDAALPTLSVLVPARNETDDLHTCLADLIASDYPKLEIIVLDDCSQDKRTPEIIRSYAQSGVRFIAGAEPSDNWLAKNYAYQQLAEAASGDYLLFCGVDLRLAPGALRELMTTMLEKQKSMMSIMPHNSRTNEFMAYLIQPMRYAWEISLPRRLFNRPPVLSTCWIITRTALQNAGSFKAASRSITPESYFARSAAHNDGYSFLRSNLLVSNKPAADQVTTALRTRYPQLRRRPELVWLLTVLEFIGVVLTLPVAVIGIAHGLWPVAVLSGLAFIIQYVVFLLVTGIMYGQPLWWGIIMAPLAAAYDLVILNTAMYRYEFGAIQWKERNICLPVMRLDVPLASKVGNVNRKR